MKVAIVHDWMVSIGGGERVVEVLHEIYPEAPIYTSFYNQKRLPLSYSKLNIIPSKLQKIPGAKWKHQFFLPLMPQAFEDFDLSDFDLVISSGACAKGVITGTNTLHINYCHTPMRYAWDLYHEYINSKKGFKRFLIGYMMKRIREWDRLAADRPDYYIANSINVAKRIKKHYRRDSEVIFPPIDIKKYSLCNEKGNFYLIVSRLVSYKRIDLAIKAFNILGIPLKIIGEGEEFKKLKSFAKNNIEFLGNLQDNVVIEYYKKCKAFIFPGEEDFGITPLEAQACGKPVIAYGKGGALETVIEGKTGLFFYEQAVEALIEKVRLMETSLNFDSTLIRKHAGDFDKEVFKHKIQEYINAKLHSDEFR